MALTQADCTSLANVYDATQGTSFTITLSAALGASRLGLVHIIAQSQANVDPSLTSVVMSGITMTQHSTTSLSTFQRQYIYRCLDAAASGTSLVLTYANTQNNVRAHTVEWANVKTSGTNGADALAQAVVRNTGTSTTPSATLGSAPATNNGVMGWYAAAVGAGGGGVLTVGTDFTVKGPTDMSTNPKMTSEAAAGSAVGDGVADATTGNSIAWYMYVLEIAEASAGGAAARRRREFVSLAFLTAPAIEAFGRIFARRNSGLLAPVGA